MLGFVRRLVSVTTGQTLKAGKSTLIVPHAHDQPDNAYRVAKTGGARVLYPHRYKAARVSAALRALLEEPQYAERAQTTAGIVAAEDGAGAAADAITRAAASRP